MDTWGPLFRALFEWARAARFDEMCVVGSSALWAYLRQRGQSVLWTPSRLDLCVGTPGRVDEVLQFFIARGWEVRRMRRGAWATLSLKQNGLEVCAHFCAVPPLLHSFEASVCRTAFWVTDTTNFLFMDDAEDDILGRRVRLFSPRPDLAAKFLLRGFAIVEPRPHLVCLHEPAAALYENINSNV